MNPLEKVCPECRCVYRLSATECSDCQVPLVFPDELPEEAEFPPASELLPYRIASVMWCRAFSDALSEAGIPHRIDAPPEEGEQAEKLKRHSHDQAVALYVRHEDRERVERIDAEFVQRQIPDMPAPGAGGEDDQGGEECCPACGDPLEETASECPGCGLFLGEPG